MTKTYLATKEETIRAYKSLAEVSPACTESTSLADIFHAMVVPSRLACNIRNGSVYPGFTGTLEISKTEANTGTATFVDADGRMSTGVFPWSGWQSPGYSNPNLLINWDFRNPVNQRGQSSYINSVLYKVNYALDMVNSQLCTITLHGGYVNVKSTKDTDYKRTSWMFEKLPAGTYTLSMRLKANTISGVVYIRAANAFGSIISNNPRTNIQSGYDGILTNTFTITEEKTRPNVEILAQNNATSYFDIDVYAAKLEVGTVSTLALDFMQPSDYAEQLRLCQRYLCTTSIQRIPVVCDKDMSIVLPVEALSVPMRIRPTVVLKSASIYALPINGGTPVDLSAYSISSGSVAKWIDGAIGLSKNQLYVINQSNLAGNYWSSDVLLWLSAEL